MIIWGSRTSNKTISNGPFHCPRCGPDKTYEKIEVRRWFTLYFIPLIPMGTEGTFIKCRMCAGTFDTSAIHYDPVVARNEFQAKLDVVLVQSLLVLAAVEGPVTEDTMQRIVSHMDVTQERDIEMDMVHSLQAEVVRRKMNIRMVLQPMESSLSDDGKVMVMRVLASAAPAMLPAQRKIIEEAGVTLGFRKKQLEPLFAPAETAALPNQA